MKKLMCMLLALLLCGSFALAEIDFSGMSFEELAELNRQIMMTMMQSDSWQEVTVPIGTYEIGKDIPAGEWQITAPCKVHYISLMYGSKLDDSGLAFNELFYMLFGTEYFAYEEGKPTTVRMTLEDGHFLTIREGDAIFTPYTGPSFSFK